jgi:hypothetical protein
VKQRALYALVRLEGADVLVALASLESKSGASQQAVLCALTDPDPTGVRPSATLPASFAPAIQRLCRRGQSPGASTDRPRLFENPFWDRREALKRALDAARG